MRIPSNAATLVRSDMTAALALLVAVAAQAEVVQYVAPQVTIDFDTDGFSFWRDSAYGGAQDIAPSSLSFNQVGNGVQVDFNGFMSALASSYVNYGPETRTATFNALFNFTPRSGYAITAYTISYSGFHNIESPGSVEGWGPGATLPSATGSGGGAFTVSGVIDGPSAPQIQGGLSATANLDTIQVFDGVDLVLDHYDQVLDYCEADDPSICYYRDEPVYIGFPQYHQETDLGEASIELSRITIQAQVVAVPESEALAMMLAGLPIAGWLAARRRGPRWPASAWRAT